MPSPVLFCRKKGEVARVIPESKPGVFRGTEAAQVCGC